MALVSRMMALLLMGVILAACVPGSVLPARESGSPTVTSPSARPGASSSAVGTQSGTGVVGGQLQRFDGTPVRGIIIYAPPIDLHGDRRLASVDPLLDPSAVTDAQGRFEIKNLKVGEHVLATQSPVGIILPHNREGQIVTFNIAANQEANLGLLPVGYSYPDGD